MNTNGSKNQSHRRRSDSSSSCEFGRPSRVSCDVTIIKSGCKKKNEYFGKSISKKCVRRQKNRRNEDKFKRPPRKPPIPEVIKNMRMTKQVAAAIKTGIGDEPAERGGILLSLSNDYTITGFVPDKAASKSKSVYQPNTKFLNKVLEGRNSEFVGIVHSHPAGFRQLSAEDQRAAWSNMTSPGNPHLNAYLMPIIQTIPDTGRFEIIPYIVTCHPEGNGRVEVKRVKLEIIG